MTALYIHWPFCKSKCPYCDFNSHVSAGIDKTRWHAAYLRELSHFGKRDYTSLFFGGGTPSLMPPELVAALIEAAGAKNVEVTLEMNPTSIEAAKLRAFKEAGVNRVSIGVQALNASDLKFLGREHSAEEARAAIQVAASIFDNYSFDLIYARPHQTVEAWRRELSEALAMAGPHLSLYQLTIEKGTPFFAAHARGEFALPDEEEAAAMYHATEEILAAAGYAAYEVSNYAKPGFECRHNLNYWRYGEYVGIGPGAHGRIGGAPRTATMMIHQPDAWLQAVEKNGHGLQSESPLSPEELREESVMMGLRLVEGMPVADAEKLNRKRIGQCLAEGLLEQTDTHLRATLKGRLVLTSLTAALLEAA